jgi:hypothetical protein
LAKVASLLLSHPADDAELLAVISVFRAPPRRKMPELVRPGRAVKKKMSRQETRDGRGEERDGVARRWSASCFYSRRGSVRADPA